MTQEEIKSLLAQGTSVGNFAPEEQQMVAGVFRLGNRRVVEVMTPRHNVCWLDVHGRREQLLETLAACPHSRLPLCDGELDRLIGIVHVKDVALALARQQPFGLREMARPSLVVPEHMDALALVDQFREKGSHIAVVVSEHGGIEGVVTPADLLEAIAGPMHEPGDLQTRRIVPREDGSWLVDGLVPVTDLKELLQVSRLPHEDEHDFATVGGFLMAGLGRVPAAADVLEWPAARVEVVDMDGNRVDKVLVTKHRAADAEEDS